MAERKQLPPRRREILEFIRGFYGDNGMAPTVRDVQKGCNISSTSVVDYNLRILERDDYISRRPDVARGIELLDNAGQPVSNAPKVQIVGAIAAGLPIPALSTEEAASSAEFDTVEVSPDLTRRYGKLYALNVAGTSMIDALIDDGDVVIVNPAPEASNGDMVVAWLKDREEVTLKKFYLEGDQVRLQPANSQMNPIYTPASNVEIHGKVVQVLRKLG
ncbi:MAG: repressor LexA [SAR202 cluster bacterium Io17-Chloro-G9]|nr:MAG: repressor LexA [SAR202 cluster bacterium Io17-Chloro-G9]